MTIVGGGGIRITEIKYKKRFKKDFKKAPKDIQDLLEKKLAQLTQNPIPSGLRFEKLKGFRRPDIYTFHLTGNYKVSLEIRDSTAILRRLACHDDMDTAP